MLGQIAPPLCLHFSAISSCENEKDFSDPLPSTWASMPHSGHLIVSVLLCIFTVTAQLHASLFAIGGTIRKRDGGVFSGNLPSEEICCHP
jgi:hypothetical protein